MPSLIAWLDASSEEQRRMRDIIRLFADRDSRDELGLGQIRDAIADSLFPGTSTLLTRARYLLFVPWAYMKASGRANPLADADRYERDTIHALRDGGDFAGLLGMQAGEALKNLPSLLYWSMLRHYGVLSDASLSREDALRLEGSRVAPDDLGESGGHLHAWSTTLPSPPEGFPKSIPGGFTLRHEEAAWLRDRILSEAPGTLFAHLAVERPAQESRAPWADPAAIDVDGDARHQLADARAFSALMHGAQLLYNLLLAEEYEVAGYDRLADPAERFRDRISQWAGDLPSMVDLSRWDLEALLMRVEVQRGSPINAHSRRFVRAWHDLVIDQGPASIVDSHSMRRFLRQRERQHKGAGARLGNRARLASWGGNSGSGALVYRWPQVRSILLDIHNGLERAPEHTHA